MAEHWHTLTFPGGILPKVSSFFYSGGVLVPPIHVCSPHAPTSVAPSLGVTSSMLHPLTHEDAQSLSDFDITMYFLVWVPPVALPHSPPIAPPPALPLDPSGIHLAPPDSTLALAVGPLCSSESIRLLDIKDAKAYLDHLKLIQYYL
jgi:hypothetical protein